MLVLAYLVLVLVADPALAVDPAFLALEVDLVVVLAFQAFLAFVVVLVADLAFQV